MVKSRTGRGQLPVADLPASSGPPAPASVTPDQLGALAAWEQAVRADSNLSPQSLQAELGKVRELQRSYGSSPDEGPAFDRGAHAAAR